MSGPLWVTERANLHFIMQRRKGSKGKGFTSIFVGTIDSVRESKPTPYRILHQAEGSEVFVLVSEAMTVSFLKNLSNNFSKGPFIKDVSSKG